MEWLFGILIMMAALVPVYVLYRLMGPISAKIQYKAGQTAVQIGGPAALYVILVWKLWGLLPAPGLPIPLYEPWDVQGKLILQDQREPIEDQDISILPPATNFGKDGSSFTMSLIATPDNVNQPKLPTLLLWHKGYESIRVDLNSGKYETENGTKEITVDKLHKNIDIGVVQLKKREN
jgi:hypothetical protein